jgi:hypothetical protein
MTIPTIRVESAAEYIAGVEEAILTVYNTYSNIH